MTKKKKGHSAAGERISWHPAFYAAAEFDFRANKADLSYEQEHQLGKEPMRIDLLIIKKRKDAVIKNEIGQFFKGCNIIEYKGPGSSLRFNDLIKTIGYACFYQAMTGGAPLALDDMTVSLFREAYPRKMMYALEEMGAVVTQKAPGIYVVDEKRLMFPVQIVVMKDLTPETHAGMRILSKKLQLKDLENFLNDAKTSSDPKDRINISAILHASGRANQDVFKEAMEVVAMPEFFEELLKDRIEAREAKSRAEGEAKGRAEGEAKGRAEGEAKGRAEGEAKGKAEGEALGRDYCAELMGILLNAGRIDDALRAASDKDYLNRLIDELVVKKH